MSFGMIISNQNIKTMQDYATRIQIILSLILKLKIVLEILQMILEKYLVYQIMKLIDHYLQERIKQ